MTRNQRVLMQKPQHIEKVQQIRDLSEEELKEISGGCGKRMPGGIGVGLLLA